MLLNDPLGIARRDVAIPRAFRIDDADRPLGADPQALAFGAVARPVTAGDLELLHPLFYEFPCFLPFRRIGTVGADADEKMPSELPHPEPGGNHRRRETVGIGHCCILCAKPHDWENDAPTIE